MTNYWLISLLTLFCKVSEKAMHCRLIHHLRTKNILVTEQYGFRPLLTKKCMLDEFSVIWQRLLCESWNFVSYITFLWNLRSVGRLVQVLLN
jgi:hypothetical protein